MGRNHQGGQHPRRRMNVPIERLREQIVTLLTAWGMDEELVRITAEVMVETDLAGVDSHGVSMLMDYESSKSRGKLNLRAVPRVVRESATTALVDADAGLGHPAAVMAMGLAIKKAKATGVGVASVFNSHHFGAAGYYAAMASKEGPGRHGDERHALHCRRADARRRAGARDQPDCLRRAGAPQRAVSPRHGDLHRRQQQDQGARAERQAAAAGLGAGRARPDGYRSDVCFADYL